MKTQLLLAVGSCLAWAGLAFGQEGTPLPPVAVNAVGAPASNAPPPAVTQGGPTVFDCPAAPAAPRCWFRSDYVLWWLKGSPLPPFVTTVDNPAAVPAGQFPGALGSDGTNVVSPSRQSFAPFSGGRLTFGAFGRNDSPVGYEVSGFMLEHNTSQYKINRLAASDPSAPLISVPFFDATSMSEAAAAFAVPGFSNGAAFASAAMKLWGAESNLLYKLREDDCVTVTALVGFRYIDLLENLDLSAEAAAPIPGVGGIGVIRSDHFGTRNQFWSGQLGLRGEWQRDICFINMSAKVALGDMHQSSDVAGSLLVQFPGTPAMSSAGGFFAEPSNSGRRSRDIFVVAPEVAVQAGVNLTRHARIYIGYDFLYLSNVIRPGDQIDQRINFTQQQGGTLVGAPVPAPIFNGSDFWVHGVSLGMSFNF